MHDPVRTCEIDDTHHFTPGLEDTHTHTHTHTPVLQCYERKGETKDEGAKRENEESVSQGRERNLDNNRVSEQNANCDSAIFWQNSSQREEKRREKESRAHIRGAIEAESYGRERRRKQVTARQVVSQKYCFSNLHSSNINSQQEGRQGSACYRKHCKRKRFDVKQQVTW